jgi:hypothetical protein
MMMMIRRSAFLVGIALLSSAGSHVRAAQSSDAAIPPFIEVYSAVRSNLTSVSDAELNQAAVDGFLSQLQSRVILVTNSAAASDLSAVPLVSKSVALEGAYGLLRIGRVAPGLSQQLSQAYDRLVATNKIKGLLVDLRFAVGDDYAAAAEAADLFFKTEQPLIQWGDHVARSTTKANAIDLPVVLLINQDTRGAAEALAAALRHAQGALIIGSPSAGRAYLFKEIQLSTGQTLRIASGTIAVGDGAKLAESGIVPDIRIAVNVEDEKAYFEDPYKVLPKPFAQAAKPSTNDLASTLSTNRPRRRVNEAELVRMQRDGIDFEAEPPPAATPQLSGPVINDPAVSRALDLLKGLTLAAKRR